jgi:hypothetical protein
MGYTGIENPHVASTVAYLQQEYAAYAAEYNQALSPPPDDSAYLLSASPDGVVAFCAQVFQSMDSQIGSYMSQQQNVSSEQNVLQELAGYMQQYETAGIHDSATAQAFVSQITSAYNQIKQLDPNSPILHELAVLHDSAMATGPGPFTPPGSSTQDTYLGLDPNHPFGFATGHTDQDNQIGGSDEITGYVNQLQAMATKLNDDTQLAMIKLQSLASMRQSFVQLGSNLEASFDGSYEKIADNIGRT